MYIVYKHTAPNGKCYIGMTCQTIERRARPDGRGYLGCDAFYNAILKYGWDSFTHEILDTGLTYDEACEKECFYIREYHSLTTEWGYNLATGGNANKVMSEESKQKMSRSLTGRKKGPLSEETKRKLRESRLGKKTGPRSEEYRKRLSEALTGRTFSEQHRQHISDSKRGVYAGSNNPRARKVLCVETGVVFDTIKDAGVFTGGSPCNIGHCCHGRLKTSGGYHWQFAEEV